MHFLLFLDTRKESREIFEGGRDGRKGKRIKIGKLKIFDKLKSVVSTRREDTSTNSNEPSRLEI